ncbi:hypothetical protein F4861DRAFT_39838 [Xylaria intraflava]|nr:hypothetical protein F4861DRAFT_39838 [Xylaria intraflava]
MCARAGSRLGMYILTFTCLTAQPPKCLCTCSPPSYAREGQLAEQYVLDGKNVNDPSKVSSSRKLLIDCLKFDVITVLTVCDIIFHQIQSLSDCLSEKVRSRYIINHLIDHVLSRLHTHRILSQWVGYSRSKPEISDDACAPSVLALEPDYPKRQKWSLRRSHSSIIRHPTWCTLGTEHVMPIGFDGADMGYD